MAVGTAAGGTNGLGLATSGRPPLILWPRRPITEHEVEIDKGPQARLFLQTKQNISILHAVIFVAESFKPEFAGGLECLYGRSVHDCCLRTISIRRLPINLCVGIGLQD